MVPKKGRGAIARGVVVPDYVRQCASGRWHLRLWRRDGTGKEVRSHFFCKSWRHNGRCAVERNQQDFRRISYALASANPKHVVFLVLTFDPSKWRDEQQMYLELKDCWRSYAKAVRREWGEMKYVSTVEKTRAGRPHLNVIMVCEGLGEALETMPKFVVQWCKDHAVTCRFGQKALFIERAASAERIAGYVVKLADAGCVGDDGRVVPGATVGEVVKTSQLPRNAPKGFRRLRSSPRFLPPAKEESEYTGALEKFPHPDDMTPEQRAGWARWEAHCAEKTAKEKAFAEEVAAGRAAYPPAPAGLEEALEGVPRWDRSVAPPSREVVVLDIDAPPDGDWEHWSWEDERRRLHEEARARGEELHAEPAQQLEFF